jgi:mRNA interferase MazF
MGNSIGEQLKEKGILEIGGYEYDERKKIVFRGEIWMADLGLENKEDGEQKGYRPVVVIQNDAGNKFAPTVIVASITSSDKNAQPTHQSVNLLEPSTIMFEQIFTISKKRLKKLVGRLNEIEIVEANFRMAVSLGLANP